jgi:hypothetical protein
LESLINYQLMYLNVDENFLSDLIPIAKQFVAILFVLSFYEVIRNYQTKIKDKESFFSIDEILTFIKSRWSFRVLIISALNALGITVESSLDKISIRYSIYFVANLSVLIFDNFVSDWTFGMAVRRSEKAVLIDCVRRRSFLLAETRRLNPRGAPMK